MSHTRLRMAVVVLLGIAPAGLRAQTDIETGTVTDIDGNAYKTVKIGTQWWMAQDLRTTRYRNGDPIGTTHPATLDHYGESAPKYQWAYDGNEANVAVYGRLYTWHAVTDERRISPCGWHIPTDAEWTTLANALGGASVAGGKLKEAGTAHWHSPNIGATNETGFTGLPSGSRYDVFMQLGDAAHYWSATEFDNECAWRWLLYTEAAELHRGYADKRNGWAVRCVKDVCPCPEPDPNQPIQNVTTGRGFDSIQCAIDYANPSDTIVIGPGIYEEHITLDKDIILRSADPNDPYHIGGTIIQGHFREPVVSLSHNTDTCQLTGLTIRAGLVGVVGTATDATIRNCRIMDNVTHGVELFENSHPLLHHCLVTANGRTGITMHATAGRRVAECQPVIENCIIVGNGQASLVGGRPTLVDSLVD